MQRKVVAGRQAQLEEKEAMKEREKEEKAYFASLLDQERQAKLEKGIFLRLGWCGGMEWCLNPVTK